MGLKIVQIFKILQIADGVMKTCSLRFTRCDSSDEAFREDLTIEFT